MPKRIDIDGFKIKRRNKIRWDEPADWNIKTKEINISSRFKNLELGREVEVALALHEFIEVCFEIWGKKGHEAAHELALTIERAFVESCGISWRSYCGTINGKCI